jgi:Zc3h12a-like Ribonuclease NYN domain/S1 RNA binding domain
MRGIEGARYPLRHQRKLVDFAFVMSRVHLVVDGSNIATEGRTAPSLAQLDDAVRSFIAQQGYETVTVIVDATFGHRIDAAESATFEAAVLAGEMVTPPAGTIGRGDAFILQVARQADADVLSNDSFQELHAEHPWLFEAGRLWGGKPVPAVGWVFVPRAPVRGVTSRRAVQAAKKAAAATALAAPAKKAAAKKEPAKKVVSKKATKKSAAKSHPTKPAVTADVEAATPANELTTTSRRRRRRGGDARPTVNDQAAYTMFVIDHPVGAIVDGTVDRFSSHGAYVGLDGGAVGYVALKSLGEPPPRSAREVLTLGEKRSFTVVRFDPTTRGIDVVPVDIDALMTSRAVDSLSQRDEAAVAQAAAETSEPDAEEAPVSPAKKAARKKAPARKAAAKKKSTAKRAPAKKKSTAKRAPAKKKSTAKRAPARKKATKKRAPAKKKAKKKRAPAKKKTTAKKTTARKKTTAKRSAAKKR